MSKTFKSAVSHREVRIWPTDAGFAIAVLDDVSNESTSTQLAPTDAPAICLAILEAAGVQAIPFDEGPESEPGHAVWALRHHVQASEAKAKEAADREKLEGEALALCSAFQDAGGYARADVMTMHHYDYGKWMDAARKAREIHGATR